MNIFTQYERNVAPGPQYAAASALPAEQPRIRPIRYLAFYLPQFHRVVENDDWWGTGFTEWTNVTKALPRFEGHLQPRLPADLGFYDLLKPDVLEAQANLARRGGIAGFCIHDYWFSGRKILEQPLDLLLQHQDIDLPFCLNWANENWSRRWDAREDQLLLEQRYDADDLTGYVKSILPAIADRRYIRVGSRPLISVYRPDLIPDPARMFDAWRDFLIKQGFENPYLAMVQRFTDLDPRRYGLDAAIGFPPHVDDLWSRNDRDYHRLFDLDYVGHVRSYRYLSDAMLKRFSTDYVTFPGICPGWDNEARKPRQGTCFAGATPAAYGDWLRQASRQAMTRDDPEERLIFVNAWNEWAEGAILEPDRHFGHAFLATTRAVLDQVARGEAGTFSQAPGDARSITIRVTNGARRKLRLG